MDTSIQTGDGGSPTPMHFTADQAAQPGPAAGGTPQNAKNPGQMPPQDALGREAAAPAVTCGLCQRRFTSKGILGRHLDRKKGDPEHPPREVEQLRANVRRRTSNQEAAAMAAPPAPSRSAEARRRSAKKYNSRPAVRDRNKQRRRARDLGIQAQLEANRWYVEDVLGRGASAGTVPGQAAPPAGTMPGQAAPPAGTMPGQAAPPAGTMPGQAAPPAGTMPGQAAPPAGTMPGQAAPPAGTMPGQAAPPAGTMPGQSGLNAGQAEANFAYLVARILPPGSWPCVGDVPGDTQFKHAVKVVSGPACAGGVSLQSLFDAYTAWQAVDVGERLGAWQRGQDRALRELGPSVAEVQSAREMIRQKCTDVYQGYTIGQFYTVSGTDSE